MARRFPDPPRRPSEEISHGADGMAPEERNQRAVFLDRERRRHPILKQVDPRQNGRHWDYQRHSADVQLRP